MPPPIPMVPELTETDVAKVFATGPNVGLVKEGPHFRSVFVVELSDESTVPHDGPKVDVT